MARISRIIRAILHSKRIMKYFRYMILIIVYKDGIIALYIAHRPVGFGVCIVVLGRLSVGGGLSYFIGFIKNPY